MKKETTRALIAANVVGSTYDNSAKAVFRHKEIIAPILKLAVPEYKDCSIADIIRYIDADTIKEDIPVEDLPPLAIDRGTENPSITEKDVSFDECFSVQNPILSSEDFLIMLHIDLEIQNNYQPGTPKYPVVSRAMYYAARELGRQLGPLKENTNYSDLRKVYSIWICNYNIPKELRNTVSIYSMKKTDLFTETNEPQSDYDLMSVIIIRRGADQEQSEMNIFDYLAGVFNGNFEILDKYTDVQSNPSIRKDVSSMSWNGLGDALVIDARLKDLKQLVIAGKISNMEEAKSFYPSLPEQDMQEIFDSIAEKKQ